MSEDELKENRQEDKNKFEKKYILLFLIPIITILIAYQTNNLFDKQEYFKTYYRKIDGASQYAILPENPYFDVVEIKPGRNTNIFYRNLDNDNIQQYEFYNHNISSDITFLTGLCYRSKKNEIYSILTNDKADYFLYKLYDKNIKFKPERYQIFHYELYDEIKDSTTTINNRKFYQFFKTESLTVSCNVIKYKDGYRVQFKKTVFDSLYKYSYSNIETDLYQLVSKDIADKLQTDFSIYDLYELIQFFLRNSKLQENFLHKTSKEFNGFLGAKIVGETDINNDDKKELLIKIAGYRWIPYLLLCYDIENEKVLWKREFLNDIRDFQIMDIDHDGKEEILFSSYAPWYNEPVDKFKQEYYGSVFQSNFYILDNQGDIKVINNKPVEISSLGKYLYKYLILEDRILLGFFSKYDNSDKKFISFDYINNKIDTLSFSYNHLECLYLENGNVIALNHKIDVLEKLILNKNFKLKRKREIKKSILYGEFIPDCLEVDMRKYSILNSDYIIDKKFNIVAECDHRFSSKSSTFEKNKIYFIENKNGKHFLSSLEFEHNKTLNPVFLLLITFELILILMYYYFRQILFLPFVSGKNRQAVLYQVFGIFYYWNIYGIIYKIDKRTSLSENYFFGQLEELTDDYEETYKKNIFGLQIRIFKLNINDDFAILKDRVHDLKNEIGRAIRALPESFNKTAAFDFKKIQKRMEDLLIFSEPLSIEKIDLISLIEDEKHKFKSHPKYPDVIFVPNFNSFHIKTDKKKIGMVIRNLLDNSLKYCTDSGKIKIEILSDQTNCHLKFLNEGEIKDYIFEQINNGSNTESDKSSGVGIRISKRIIEKLDGDLKIQTADNMVIITVSLPLKQINSKRK